MTTGRLTAPPAGDPRPDLVGTIEIAERAGVKRDTVAKWQARHPDFPRPVARLGMGPVWAWGDVEAWLRLRAAPERA